MGFFWVQWGGFWDSVLVNLCCVDCDYYSLGYSFYYIGFCFSRVGCQVLVFLFFYKIIRRVWFERVMFFFYIWLICISIYKGEMYKDILKIGIVFLGVQVYIQLVYMEL